MELTILGRYAPYAPAGGAGPGYLIRSGEVNLLLDGGPGTLSRLQQTFDPARLTAIMVSHLHEDHVSDLHSLQFAIWDAQQAGRRTGPLRIYAPLEPAWVLEWLAPDAKGSVEILPLPVETGISFGHVTCRYARTDHPRPCWAIRIEDGSGSMVYTGDTGTKVDLAPFAREADALLVEATYTEATGGHRHIHGHLTGGEAGDLARRAGVKRLLLTHLRPNVDHAEVLAEARSLCPAAEMVEEMRSYSIGR
jgi:ribonuclease BN (tRNA processing enzyme)